MPLDGDLIDWADRIFTMEARHRRYIQRAFRERIDGKPIVNLGIPDRYRYMDAALVALLERRMAVHLP